MCECADFGCVNERAINVAELYARSLLNLQKNIFIRTPAHS